MRQTIGNTVNLYHIVPSYPPYREMARAHKNRQISVSKITSTTPTNNDRRPAHGDGEMEKIYVAPVGGEVERHGLNQLERTPKGAAAPVTTAPGSPSAATSHAKLGKTPILR
jgi:hypothetical protein